MTWGLTLPAYGLLCCLSVFAFGLAPERPIVNMKQAKRQYRMLHIYQPRQKVTSNINYVIPSPIKPRIRRSERFCSSRVHASTGRQLPCCRGRNDSCSVSFYGTTCYCDSFCNRKVDSDCCPDFSSNCLHQNRKTTTVVPPVKHLTTEISSLVHATAKSHVDTGECFYNGHTFKAGDVTKINCNRCVCESVVNGYYQLNCEDHVCLVRPNIVEAINKGGYSWKAANYSFLWGLTRDEGYRLRLGTKKVPKLVSEMTELHTPAWPGPIPKHFDARVKWPGLISQPRDQGNCGSSWAFSTSSVASDRLSIQSNGEKTVVLSPYHLMSCLTSNSCFGERLDRAWWFLRKRGVVSTSCYPAATETCKFHLKKRELRATCPSGAVIGKSNVHKSSPTYKISRLSSDIKWEIFNNGPVQALIRVWPDFFSYKSGIYVATNLDNLLDKVFKEDIHHSVKVIGWGTEKDDLGFQTNYWIAQNSWGTGWGEDGYFRIHEGELGIESMVIAAWANVH